MTVDEHLTNRARTDPCKGYFQATTQGWTGWKRAWIQQNRITTAENKKSFPGSHPLRGGLRGCADFRTPHQPPSRARLEEKAGGSSQRGDTMSESVQLPLKGGVQFELQPTSDGIEISLLEETDTGEEVHYSVTESRDFFQSEQKRRTIINRIEDSVPDFLDADTALEKVETLMSELNRGISDEQEAKLQAPIVQELRSQTQDVVYIPDEELRIIVTLCVDGREGDLEFSAGQWNASSPKPLRDQYLTQFYERIEVEAEHWEDLTEYWHERRTVEEREALTKREQIYEDTLRRLQTQKLKVYDEKHHFTAPEATWNAFYDDDGVLDDTDIPDDDPVVWVRSDVLREILDDEGHGDGYIAQLSQTLREKGTTHTKSRKKNLVTRVYPFKPAAVGVDDPDRDVIYPERDDQGVPI